MRGRTKLVSLATVLAVMLTVSMVFASGILDVSKFSILQAVEPDSPGPTTLFVTPKNTVSPALQSGSTFTVYVNITDVADLYTWQINMTWNVYYLTQTAHKPVLSLSLLVPGEFLARSAAATSSEILGIVINTTDNTIGYSAFAETITTDVSGVTSVPGGRLVGLQFLVVGYGSCDFTISLTGTLPATLLSSTGTPITISSTTKGYFRNKYIGDVDGDKYCGSNDLALLRTSYGYSPPAANYQREADMDPAGAAPDNYVGSGDLAALRTNYGKSFP